MASTLEKWLQDGRDVIGLLMGGAISLVAVDAAEAVGAVAGVGMKMKTPRRWSVPNRIMRSITG